MEIAAGIGVVVLIILIFVIRWLIGTAVAKGEQAVTNAVRHEKNKKMGSEMIYLRDVYPDLVGNVNNNPSSGGK